MPFSSHYYHCYYDEETRVAEDALPLSSHLHTEGGNEYVHFHSLESKAALFQDPMIIGFESSVISYFQDSLEFMILTFYRSMILCDSNS